ncbi:MAG TPA: right-handed parallel beta-helix repeat-containing protein [Streptosporangiaceae bacterium]
MPHGAMRSALAAKDAMARIPRPALFGAVVAIVTLVVAAALPGGGGSNEKKDLADVVGRHLAASGGRFAPRPVTVLRVYLAPDGSDSNDGTAQDRAVRTLDAVQRVIAAARPDTDVEVRIQHGTYVAAPVQWTTYVPGHTITFLPIDYEFGEGAAGIGSRPIFRGDGRNGFWLRATQQPAGAPLSFYFLQVEGYSAGAIAFDGAPATGTRQNTAPATGNTVYGMAFRRLGSKYVRSGVGYGAIDLINSRDNVIQNNSFEYLENIGGSARQNLVHGVYLSHHSSNNLIRNNRFLQISGDPIRARDDSNENKIFANTFTRTGASAYFSDWFFTGGRPKKNTGPVECASRANAFYDNTLNSGYRGRIDVLWISPLGDAYAASGCDNNGQGRVHAWGNQAG